MRRVPCVVILACCCLGTGCSLFRGQSSGDGKRPWFATGPAPKQSPAAPGHLPADELIGLYRREGSLESVLRHLADLTSLGAVASGGTRQPTA